MNKETIMFLVGVVVGAILFFGITEIKSQSIPSPSPTPSPVITQEQIRLNKLDGCMSEAEKEFERLREVNSELSPTEENENQRTWTSVAADERITGQYNTDREICIGAYK